MQSLFKQSLVSAIFSAMFMPASDYRWVRYYKLNINNHNNMIDQVPTSTIDTKTKTVVALIELFIAEALVIKPQSTKPTSISSCFTYECCAFQINTSVGTGMSD